MKYLKIAKFGCIENLDKPS